MIAALLGYLVNAAWQVPLLAMGAFALARFGTLSPRARNLVWLGCLTFSVVLPALQLPSFAPPPPPMSAAEMEAIVQASSLTSVSEPTTHPFEIDLDGGWARVLAAGFTLVIAVGLARLSTGWFAVRRLVRGARDIILPPEIAAELQAAAASHHMRAPQVRQSARTLSPAVAGVLAQTILVPRGFAARPQPEVRAALLHELAHALRRDYAVNLLSEAVSLPIAWHPVTHLIKAEIRRTRELACDAMASKAMCSERAYAQSLLALAQSLDSAAPGASLALVGLFGKPSLEERLMYLIGPKPTAKPALKTFGLFTGAAVAVGMVSAAVLLHVPTALAAAETFAAPPAVPALRSAPAVAPRPPIAALPAPSVPAAPAAPSAPPAPAPARFADLAAPAAPPQLARAAAAPIPPAPPAPPAAEDGGEDGVIIDSDHGTYRHERVSASGRRYTVMTDGRDDLSPAERARLQQKLDHAMEKVRKATAMLDSPEFKAKLAKVAQLNTKEIERTARLASLKALDDPRIKAQLADAQRARVEAMKALDDPKVKAEIARAEHLRDSPEFKKAMADLEAARAELRNVDTEH